MKSIFYLLDVAPYSSEKAFGLLNAAVLSIKLDATVGLYGDGVYLALEGQNGQAIGIPNLSDIINAYPEIKVLAHEPSLLDRGLFTQRLIEKVELVDEERFFDKIMASNSIILV